jgi:hypothetical protein
MKGRHCCESQGTEEVRVERGIEMNPEKEWETTSSRS